VTARPRALFVMRHGKSDWDSDAVTDLDRPLARRGRRDCRTMASWCAQVGLLPDVLLSSPAERAADTARRLGRGLGLDDDDVTLDERLYMAELPELLAVLAGVRSDASQVVLVGHNPGLDALVAHLHGRKPPAGVSGKVMTTAAVAHFRMPADWSSLRRGAGKLVEVVRPKELPAF